MRRDTRRLTWLSLVLVLGLGLLAACSDDASSASGDTGDDQGADMVPDQTGGDFVFSETAAGDYDRVDRAGMPAINTAVITDKDGYNAADPADDALLTFAPEIIENLQGLHGALDDDLSTLGLASCASGTDPVDVMTCVNQGVPLVIPDTLKIDTATAAGFPNGRMLTDPVIDVTLAVILLDVSTPGDCGGSDCTVTTLAELPLNPPANDVAFGDSFPYLAAPN